jgi:hypothetical protein
LLDAIDLGRGTDKVGRSDESPESLVSWYITPMSANLTRQEWTLLQYLHDRSGIPGARFGLDPKFVRRGLRISTTHFARDSASLAARGFAAVRYARSDAGDVSTPCSAIWVTSKGEDYLKKSGAENAKLPED